MRYTLLTSCAIAAIALGAGLAKAQGPAQVQGQGQTQAQGSGQTTQQGPDAQRQREPSTGRQTSEERSNPNAGRREGTERREERNADHGRFELRPRNGPAVDANLDAARRGALRRSVHDAIPLVQRVDSS